MKIHALCLVKNEGDIIEEVLQKASVWCDFIYLMDNGSDDGTWETILRLSKEKQNLIPFIQTEEPYSNSLRSQIFNTFRRKANPGDWWCRLDADEIYEDDPRQFLDNIPRFYKVVWGLQHQFYFTEEDLAAYERSPDTWISQPVEQRMNYYECNYSETRFFRHRDRLKWDAGHWPRHLGLPYPNRIRLKHYQFRSPKQMQTRLRVRTRALAQGCDTLSHYKNFSDWHDAIRNASDLNYLNKGGHLESQPEINNPRHLESFPRRVLKGFLHTTGVFP
jgi:glycosyltransferase involved in cell wall biosynthesis